MEYTAAPNDWRMGLRQKPQRIMMPKKLLMTDGVRAKIPRGDDGVRSTSAEAAASQDLGDQPAHGVAHDDWFPGELPDLRLEVVGVILVAHPAQALVGLVFRVHVVVPERRRDPAVPFLFEELAVVFPVPGPAPHAVIMKMVSFFMQSLPVFIAA